MSFHVGQKVVCVEDGRLPGHPQLHGRWDPSDRVVRGEIYTVTRVYVFQGLPCLWLAEVTRCQGAVDEWGPNVGYDHRRFRPLIERKSSTSTGFEILDDIRKRESLPVSDHQSADNSERSRPAKRVVHND